MEYLIEVIIYLLAILGIIFTSISFYEMFDLKKYINNSYRIFYKKSTSDKKIDVILHIYGYDEFSEQELIKYLKKDNVNLKEIANSIIIEK